MRASSIKRAAAAAALVLALAAPAHGQDDGETEPSVSVAFDLASSYAWRGLRLSDGLVGQTTIAGGFGGFGVEVWSNYDPGEYPVESGSRRRITETDVTFSYASRVRGAEIAGGIVYYAARGGADTSELFVSCGLDTWLQPSAALYLDVDEGDGAFAVFGVGHSVSLPRGATLDVAAEAGFNIGNEAMGLDANERAFTGPYHGEVSAAATLPVWRGVSLAGRLSVSTPIGSRAARAIESSGYSGDTRTFVHGSVGVTLGF